jgi:hypothetical protein
MPRTLYLVSSLRGGFKTVILASGQQIIPVFDDSVLARSWSDKLIASGSEPTTIMSLDLGTEGTRSFVLNFLAKQGLSGVVTVFPEDKVYWPLIKALQL